MKLKFVIFLLLSISIFKITLSQQVIEFMNTPPVIDGELDHSEFQNQLRPFPIIEKSNNANFDIPASYFLGYGSSFLYLYIQFDSDEIIMRDRAYQNGDGFHMVIAKPLEDDSATDEFYVLAFSPDKKAFGHKKIWYYNVDLSREKLGDEVKFEVHTANNKAGFELLIPWKSIQPYHPWLSKEIGFNLCFVKAIGDIEKNYYFLVNDNKIQSEQSKRKYEKLRFLPPRQSDGITLQLGSNHIRSNEFPTIKIGSVLNKETIQDYLVKIYSGENQLISKQKFKKLHPIGLFKEELVLDKQLLAPGGYRINIEADGKKIDYYLTVLPKYNFEVIQNKLDQFRGKISNGTYNTLSLYNKEIKSALNELKKYENSYEIRASISEISENIKQLKNGKDPLLQRKGVFRRGFLSRIDSTIRPYSIYIPDNYKKDKKYPLLVYLHGSGEDERSLFYCPKIKEDFIILTPNGRGTSNCYATNSSQIDIEEAIEDLTKNYKIDTSNIILSGFSMGGYGVYQTYFHHPKRYKAIAILSGHPDLGPKWGFPEGKDFLKDENLKKFNDVPIFVFHGQEDRNCPFELTKILVKKFKTNGCEVKFNTEKSGHNGMNKINQQEYHQWLREQIKK